MNQHIVSNCIDAHIAECIGLWLAEGDNKTISEITFTNNQIELVLLFNETMKKLFSDEKQNIRVYIFSKDKMDYTLPFIANKKSYLDVRANKPYFIWRIASRRIVKLWHSLVDDYKINSNTYVDILRGFSLERET